MIKPTRSWAQKAMMALVLAGCALLAAGIIAYVANKPTADMLAAQKASDESLQKLQEKVIAQAEVVARAREEQRRMLAAMEQTRAERDAARSAEDQTRQQLEQEKFGREQAQLEKDRIRSGWPETNSQPGRLVATVNPDVTKSETSAAGGLQGAESGTTPGSEGQAIQERDSYSFFCVGNRTSGSVAFEVSVGGTWKKHSIPARKMGVHRFLTSALARGETMIRYHSGHSTQTHKLELYESEEQPSRSDCVPLLKNTFVDGRNGLIHLRVES